MTLTAIERAAWQKAAEHFLPKPEPPYLHDPVGWINTQLGEHLWSRQREIAESVVANRRTAVKSCHNAGKSWIASRIAAWWIASHPPGQAFVASTAPSYPQVHAILWEEIRKAQRVGAQRGNNAVPGRVLQSDEWKLDDSTLVGWGRKPADTDEHGFQGIHRRYVLVILDEACGIPRQLWTAVEAITTGPDCRILAIGNPDDPSTEFADVCKPGSGWNVIRISAFDTPNFTDEPFPEELRPLMLDPGWVEDKRRRWGVESPRYVSKILGDFPDLGTDTLISPSLLEAAQLRKLEPTGRRILGVDVARYGMDRTVIMLRRGPVLRLHGEYSKQATTETTGRVIAAKRDTDADEIRVDGVGVGGGVVDQLAEQGHGVLDMQAGGRAQDPERFLNARSEWAWSMRQRLEDGDLDLDPDDDELVAQLGALKYRYNSRGQIVIESKDEMRKRGMPSPDRADAAILTVINSPGADLFPKLNWRYFSPVPHADLNDRVNYGGQHATLSEGWTFGTAWLPSGEDAVSDWAVAAVWTRLPDGNLLMRGMSRIRLGDADPTAVLVPMVRDYAPDTMFVYRKQLTASVVASAARARVPVTDLILDPDPFARVLPASAQQVSGRIWLPADAPWSMVVRSECQAFPHGRQVGCIETLAAAVHVVATRWVPPPPPGALAPRRQPDPFAALGDDNIDFMRTAI